jgi:hypothetical protein
MACTSCCPIVRSRVIFWQRAEILSHFYCQRVVGFGDCSVIVRSWFYSSTLIRPICSMKTMTMIDCDVTKYAPRRETMNEGLMVNGDTWFILMGVFLWSFCSFRFVLIFSWVYEQYMRRKACYGNYSASTNIVSYVLVVDHQKLSKVLEVLF